MAENNVGTEGIDGLKEAQRLIGQFSPDKMQAMLQTPLDERAYLLKLASTWALVDIAKSLRSIALKAPFPE